MNSTGVVVINTRGYGVHFIVQVSLTGLTSALGIIANIINIIVFTRQMKSENSGASLRGLAITDLLTVIASLWHCINWGVVIANPPNLPWIPFDVKDLIASGPYIMFAQMTKIETAYVAFERCVCVVFPFKVKTIFTSKRTNMVTGFIIIICVISNSPFFIVQWPGLVTDPRTNVTRLGVMRSSNWMETLHIMYAINTNLFNMGSVIIVVVCTITTIFYVRLSKTWRESVTSVSTSDNSQRMVSTTSETMSDNKLESSTPKVKAISKSKMQKEKKLVLMITLISLMFFLSLLPAVIFLILSLFNFDFRAGSLGIVLYSLSFYLQTINSSCNIVVYYIMSTKFKQEVKGLLKTSNELKR